MAVVAQEGPVLIRDLVSADYGTLARWLSDRRVLAFYEGRDRPHSLDLVRMRFGTEDGVRRCILVFAGRDVGYVQFYREDDAEMRSYGWEADPNAYGVDLFIGEVDLWNRGVGTRALSALCRHLFQVGATRIVVDPQAWNTRAIRCYEKCGFRQVRYLPAHEWHEGILRDCWLMELVGGPPPTLHIALVEPEIPANTGNVGRTCVLCGVHLHLVRPLGFSLDDRYLRRAGLDYWAELELSVHESWTAFLDALQGRAMWYFSGRGALLYTDVSYAPGDVLVFGRESRGLSEEILSATGDRCLRIPMLPQTRSLNLSNAVAIGVFEALRQLNFPGLV